MAIQTKQTTPSKRVRRQRIAGEASVKADAIRIPSRTIGYIRVSSDQQASEGQSLQVQEQQLRGWAMQHGKELAQVVCEAGVSGGIPFSERPEGAKLWAYLQRSDTLVASKLDRMFRSAGDCLAVVEAFKARGVSLYLLDLNGGADDVSGNGIARLFLTIVSAFAEFERNRIGERIRASKQRSTAAGIWSGGARRFGWRKGAAKVVDGRSVYTLEPVPAEQAEIKRIMQLARQGKSTYAIRDDLAERGHKLSHVSIGKLIRRTQQEAATRRAKAKAGG